MQHLVLRLALGLTPVLAGLAKEEVAPQPHFVVPDDWATDRSRRFLLLPLSVYEGLDPGQCKVLTDGDKILVVVTEQPQEVPETLALRKYRLVVEALKSEAGHDEQMLQSKYEEWLATEEDDEVRVFVQAALDSLHHVHAAKIHPEQQIVSVPLGLSQTHFLQAPVYPSSVLQLSGTEASERGPTIRLPHATTHHALVRQSIGSAATQDRGGKRKSASLRGPWSKRRSARSMTKEQFSVDIPYPAPPESVFILKTSPNELIVAMPLIRSSLGASGISTGGVPYSRVPVFDISGRYLAGPRGHDLQTLAAGLELDALSTMSGLVALAA